MGARKPKTKDDIARSIGNRAIEHLRTMYPEQYAATYPSCRLSLRNHIRNDVNALLKAIEDRNNGTLAWLLDHSDEFEFEPLAIEHTPTAEGGKK